jgi:hypothetical protein
MSLENTIRYTVCDEYVDETIIWPELNAWRWLYGEVWDEYLGAYVTQITALAKQAPAG